MAVANGVVLGVSCAEMATPVLTLRFVSHVSARRNILLPRFLNFELKLAVFCPQNVLLTPRLTPQPRFQLVGSNGRHPPHLSNTPT